MDSQSQSPGTTFTIEFLGTGGAVRTPRPNCTCQLCTEARAQGSPWARMGPSIFVHGPNVLIDTPEDIYEQLNRTHIPQIDAGFYSHWHPDHTAGRRVYETRNADSCRKKLPRISRSIWAWPRIYAIWKGENGSRSVPLMSH